MDLSYSHRLIRIPNLSGIAPNLEFLYLYECKSLIEIPSLQNLSNLVELHMRCSKLIQLWNGGDKIEPLGNFKLMDLSYSHDLMRIPDLSSIAPNIEFLSLKRCYSLVEIPSLKNLSNLTELDLCECYKVKDCPEIPCNIKILTLDYTGIEQLPSSIKHLSQLVTLSLNECTELVSLPSSIGYLKRLEQLNLVGCSRLMTIPSSIGNLKRLEELHLGGCSRLVTIPSSIGELKCLEKLLLFRCSNLASLPKSIKQLSKLKQLDLSICESLKILPELPSCLECLVAGNCPSLESALISFHFSEQEDENEEADKSEDENEVLWKVNHYVMESQSIYYFSVYFVFRISYLGFLPN
ncbi:disease resistance protein TAO1-like isoform X2 [Hevea brasiliensis]|nr:disease resistance protein TAO1-like isoform X2 [Hevea brasiliensis]XP_057989502.1 disease resistance protein TAO1-like isoform X2 [Hevea brasiliensis]